MELKKSLQHFVEVFGRDDFDLGSIAINTSAQTEGEDLDAFYELLSFDKLFTIVGTMFVNVVPQSQLSKAQEGWGVIYENGVAQKDNTHWNDSWVVFGDRNDDAIFFDKDNGKVYGSIEKTTNLQLAESLAMFFEVLAECMLLEQHKYDFEATDDDCEPLPQFVEDVLQILLKHTSEDKAEEFIEFFFG